MCWSRSSSPSCQLSGGGPQARLIHPLAPHAFAESSGGRWGERHFTGLQPSEVTRPGKTRGLRDGYRRGGRGQRSWNKAQPPAAASPESLSASFAALGSRCQSSSQRPGHVMPAQLQGQEQRRIDGTRVKVCKKSKALAAPLPGGSSALPRTPWHSRCPGAGGTALSHRPWNQPAEQGGQHFPCTPSSTGLACPAGGALRGGSSEGGAVSSRRVSAWLRNLPVFPLNFLIGLNSTNFKSVPPCNVSWAQCLSLPALSSCTGVKQRLHATPEVAALPWQVGRPLCTVCQGLRGLCKEKGTRERHTPEQEAELKGAPRLP